VPNYSGCAPQTSFSCNPIYKAMPSCVFAGNVINNVNLLPPSYVLPIADYHTYTSSAPLLQSQTQFSGNQLNVALKSSGQRNTMQNQNIKMAPSFIPSYFETSQISTFSDVHPLYQEISNFKSYGHKQLKIPVESNPKKISYGMPSCGQQLLFGCVPSIHPVPCSLYY
jgi:hypothetical protein